MFLNVAMDVRPAACAPCFLLPLACGHTCLGAVCRRCHGILLVSSFSVLSTLRAGKLF